MSGEAAQVSINQLMDSVESRPSVPGWSLRWNLNPMWVFFAGLIFNLEEHGMLQAGEGKAS
jgi:hypothetical protein